MHGCMRLAVGLLALLFLPTVVGAADGLRPFTSTAWLCGRGKSAMAANDFPAWSKARVVEGWQPLPAWADWGPEPTREPLWLRTLLPPVLPDSAALFFESAPDLLEIYVGGQRVYADGSAS